MSDKCKFIRGVVVIEGSTPVQGLEGVQVHLGTLRGVRFHTIGLTETSKDGQFAFDLNTLVEGDKGALFYELRVFNKDERLEAHGDVRWRRLVDPGPLVVCVEPKQVCAVPVESVPQLEQGHNVYGRIRHDDGTPLADVLVEVHAVTLTSESSLATDLSTDNNGWYSTQLVSPADLLVKVYEPAVAPNTPRLLGTSRVLYNPSLPVRIDVKICDDSYRRKTEWARISTALNMEIGSTQPEALGTRAIAVLSGRTGWDIERVLLWVLAYRMGALLSVDEQSLYGLLRVGFPRNAESLASRPPSAVTAGLKLAARQNIIALSLVTTTALASFIAALKSAYESALNNGRADSLGEILATSGVLSSGQISDFIDLFIGYSDSTDQFWTDLAALSSYASASGSAAEAKRLITLGTLALSHAPTVSSILVTIGTAPAAATAALTDSDWTTITSSTQLSSLPSGLPGSTDTEQRQALADYLAEHAELMFPSQTARAGLTGTLSGGHPLTNLAGFLTSNTSFDLATSRVADFSGSDLQLEAARLAQRLYRISPSTDRAAAVLSLAEAGYTSAHSVARQGLARFISDTTGYVSPEVAEEVYRKASTLTAVTSTFFAQAHPHNSQASLAFLPNADFDTADIPDWETLFGNTDGCSCAQCRSIHGPAAYLVDLLHWLESRKDSDGTSTLYDNFIARRPDIPFVELSCENTDRVLPYIDLVMEALESAVVHTGDIDADAAHNTLVTTSEMLASPQHRDPLAYSALEAETSRMDLPFHRPLAEARAFLQHLGVPRSQLMHAFETLSGSHPQLLAVERLGLSAAGLNAILDASGTETGYWSVASSTSELQSVSTLRRAAQITWPDILDLLHTRSANLNGLSGPVFSVSATDYCDIETYTIQDSSSGSTDAEWRPWRQFIRLWRTTGYSILDLDKILTALGVTTLTATTGTVPPWAMKLADLRYLSELTGLSALELSMTQASQIDTWQDRDSRDEPVLSLYDQVFLSPAVLVEGDPEKAFFELNTGRTGLVDETSYTLSDHGETIAGALGLSVDELNDLKTILSDDVLSLANLSQLYSAAMIGRAAGLKPADLLSFVGLKASWSPWNNTGHLVEVVEAARELSAAGWTVAELAFVLMHEQSERVLPDDSFFQTALGKVRAAVRAAYDALNADSSEATVRDSATGVLAEALEMDKDALDALRPMAWPLLPSLVVDEDFTFAEDADVSLSSSLSASVSASTPAVLRTGTTVNDGSSTFALTEDTVVLFKNTTTASITNLVVPQGSAWQRASSSTAKLASGLEVQTWELGVASTVEFTRSHASAPTLTLTAPAVVDLPQPLTHTLTAVTTGNLVFGSGASTTDLVQRFLRSDFLAEASDLDQPYDDITDAGVYAHDFEVLRALFKTALIFKHLQLNDEERAWYTDSTKLLAWNIAAPDGANGSGASAFTYTPLKALIDLFAQRSRIPGESPSFVSLLDTGMAGTAADFATALSERTGWSEGDIEDIAGLTGSEPNTVDSLVALLDRMDIVRRVGASGATVGGWAVATGSLTSTLSAEVVNAARSHYATPEAWASVARPVRDQLRRAQRDALLSYLLGHAVKTGDSSVEDAEDLYQKYLIDVSMNPEMLTSRIVQANATVQLYIHRLMLGLELSGSTGDALFEPTDEDRAQWEWMRTYRVWEAARKVFLYPENWVEPELRDNKSPFFKLLERELSQGDVNDERVETALLDYLDRLREVSRLEVLGYYWQKEDVEGADDVDILHVFGRSRTEPPSYWVRRFEDHSTWTAWEPVECGAEGSHLTPVVWGRRLMLFWATFAEASDTDTEGGTNTELSLSWSEFRGGKWSPKRISSPVLVNTASWKLGIVSSLDSEGRLVLSVVERDDMCDAETCTKCEGSWTIAHFTLNPCTLELEAELDTGLDEVVRRGAVDTYWVQPGFATDYDPEDGMTYADYLTVYRGEVDADNEALSSSVPSEVRLLSDAAAMTMVVPNQYTAFVSQAPFFVQNADRCWFVLPDPIEPSSKGSPFEMGSLREGTSVAIDNQLQPSKTSDANISIYATYTSKTRYTRGEAVLELASADEDLVGMYEPGGLGLLNGGYRFYTFYHPHTCTFTKAVRRDGPFALLDPDPQGPESELARQQIVGDFDFDTELQPNPLAVALPYPVEDVDFSDIGAMSLYNWELFFHIPLYIACRLSDNAHEDDAMNYFHCIFDPRSGGDDVPSTVSSGATARWWKVAPLMEPVSTPVTDWINFTLNPDGSASQDFLDQVEAWRDDPFNPHLIARLRPGTYQKVVVMKYIENLIAWGDRLFTKDTIESINEATQLYVFAKQILGKRPETLEPKEKPTPKTYDALRDDLDEFGNVVLENAFTSEVPSSGSGSSGTTVTSMVGLTYFCIPQNARLISTWDTVADRLYKIRNGMNIEGVVRSLPLFEPPIDPAMLVRAAAAGMDIGSAVDSLTVELPNYRFNVMHGRAMALASSVRNLGGAMLSALEKNDAEAVARLRSEHELALMDAVKLVRERQVDEAKKSLEVLQASKKTVTARKRYYDGLISKGLIGEENTAAALTQVADIMTDIGGGYALLGTILGLIPDVSASCCPSVETGGAQGSRVMGAFSQIYTFLASHNRNRASYLATMAGYKRRAQEWKQQAKQADLELAGMEKQIAAAKLRIEIAKKELHNHELQTTHAEEMLDWNTRKFTNEDLYSWMVSQLSALHFQQYQFALSVAKKAEACYNHELGRSDSFLQPLYWDSLRKGLLAGERLTADLERMDAAYLEHDDREYELHKHVSLRRLDPMALERLRSEGECFFKVPQVLFDLDCPGHYFRRISGVAISVACVSGAQSQVNLQLTLHGSRLQRSAGGSLEEQSCSYPSIVTSSAMEDPGVFNTGSDGRYLPFERLGAVSDWNLRFCNQDYPQIDWESVSDVILHLRYTARDGGETARQDAMDDLDTNLEALSNGFTDTGISATGTGFMVGLSARRDDPDAWYTAEEAASGSLTLTLGNDRLPYFAVGKITAVNKVYLLVPSTSLTAATITPSSYTPNTPTVGSWISGYKQATTTFTAGTGWPATLALTLTGVTVDQLSDLIVILECGVN